MSRQIVFKALNHIAPNVSHVGQGEMSHFAFFVLVAMEWAFHSVRVLYIEFSEHDNPRSGLFWLLYFEAGRLETETLRFVPAQQRENPNLSIFNSALILEVLVSASIEENVWLTTMPVHIAIQGYFTLPL